jgi:hypothetical protein
MALVSQLLVIRLTLLNITILINFIDKLHLRNVPLRLISLSKYHFHLPIILKLIILTILQLLLQKLVFLKVVLVKLILPSYSHNPQVLIIILLMR